MSIPKFKKGDEVKTHYGARAIIDALVVKDGVRHYEITFKDRKNTDLYKEDQLKFWLFALDEEPPTKTLDKVPEKCPKCGTEWSVTRFGAKKWYDCLECGKKAEDLVSSLPTGPGISAKQEESVDDWDRMWKKVLDDVDDDDGFSF